MVEVAVYALLNVIVEMHSYISVSSNMNIVTVINRYDKEERKSEIMQHN